MGNTLPSNPTTDDYIVYAGKIEKSKPERAIEIYEDIVRDFRLQKKWRQAIDILLKIAKLQVDGEKGKTFTDIANLYKKIEASQEYIEYLGLAVDTYQACGNFASCGKYSALIAEEYENNLDFKNAIDYYTRCVDYYGMADMETNSNRYTIKLATLSALDPSTLETAITIFEKIAEDYSKNKLTIYSVSEYLFRAGICRLLKNDLEEARKSIGNYSIDYPIFSDKREAKFLNDILNALEERDVNVFTSVVIDYNNISTVDNWGVSMLLSIKKNISEPNLC